MSEGQEKHDHKVERGYQPKIDRPPGKPPTGGSAVKKPPRSEQKT
jgi:cysteine desulfurase